MKTIIETFKVITFVLLWMAVLPIAGLVEVGVMISDKVEGITTHKASAPA